jgi:hypothetical protein
VVKSVAGSIASGIISNRWSNITEIKEMRDPILFVHGKRDTLIPYQHSQVRVCSVSANCCCDQDSSGQRLLPLCASPHCCCAWWCSGLLAWW